MTEEEKSDSGNKDNPPEPAAGGREEGADRQKAEKKTHRGGSHPWESELGSYPLREPGEDPGWAVKIVKIWLGIALVSGLFIMTLIVLGFFYD